MSYKDKENYKWAVNNLKKYVWRPLRVPKILITDRDAALRKALHTVFPDSQANLCTWHINRNITTNCKKYFPLSISKETSNKAKDHWELFNSGLQKVTCAKTKALFKVHLDDLNVFLATQPAVLNYLETNILPVKELVFVAWACQHPHL
jgi:transposase-like protein